MEFDTEYPGTAVQRLNSVHQRVKTLTPAQLNGDWQEVRRKLLWAGKISPFPRNLEGSYSALPSIPPHPYSVRVKVSTCKVSFHNKLTEGWTLLPPTHR